jgi:mRNA export factor
VQVHATFATSGSDGAYNFWDKDSRQRLKMEISARQWVGYGLLNILGEVFMVTGSAEV